MSDEPLDLTGKDPDKPRPANGRRTRSDKGKPRGRRSSKLETEIESRVERMCKTIAKKRDARGDTELAEALRDEGSAIGSALSSGVRAFPPFRAPVLLFLAVAEPLVACWRVGGILITRLVGRREAQRREVAAQAGFDTWEDFQASMMAQNAPQSVDADGNPIETPYTG